MLKCYERWRFRISVNCEERDKPLWRLNTYLSHHVAHVVSHAITSSGTVKGKVKLSSSMYEKCSSCCTPRRPRKETSACKFPYGRYPPVGFRRIQVYLSGTPVSALGPTCFWKSARRIISAFWCNALLLNGAEDLTFRQSHSFRKLVVVQLRGSVIFLQVRPDFKTPYHRFFKLLVFGGPATHSFISILTAIHSFRPVGTARYVMRHRFLRLFCSCMYSTTTHRAKGVKRIRGGNGYTVRCDMSFET
jgi:hypothetical protein